MEKQERKQEPKRDPQAKDEVKANPKVVEAGKKLKEDIAVSLSIRLWEFYRLIKKAKLRQVMKN